MLDLRKQIAQSGGKTVSRKARSKPASAFASKNQTPITSPNASRPSSRPVSRYASEDEHASDSEDEGSTALSSTGSDGADDNWGAHLQESLEALGNRKRGNQIERIEYLKAFLHITRHYYAGQQLDNVSAETARTLFKSINGGATPEEQVLGLRALASTILSCVANTIDGPLFRPLRLVCEDAEDEQVKAEALRTMAVAAIYGNDDNATPEDVLEFLVGIVQSDGTVVGAEDSGAVVSAAMDAWVFVAAHQDDLSDYAEEGMEAFVEQLESTDPHVQTSAGSNIAFLFEASREHEEETGATLPLPYDPKELVRRLAQLSRGSQSVSRKNRRHVRTNLNSVITSLELGKGPGYSTALTYNASFSTEVPKDSQPDHEDMVGYREKVRVGDYYVVVDSWSLMARLTTIKKVLGGGFQTHFSENPTISDLFSDAELERSPRT